MPSRLITLLKKTSFTFICLLALVQISIAQPWTQLGVDIDGEAVDDQSGISVSISADGNRIAIGAFLNDGAGNNAGHVRIFEWTGTSWTQVGVDLDGEAANDSSGFSVSLSADGNRIAIGAPDNNGGLSFAGHVRIYEWLGTNWTQLGADIDGEAVLDRSGFSVSLSADGNRVAVGSRRNSGLTGHVRIYEWTGSNWAQLGVDIDGEAPGDQSGYNLSLSADGSRIAIGAIENDDNGSSSGHVRIFEWLGTNWTQLGADIDGEAGLDQSGGSVSLSANGSRVAIGAEGNNGGGTGLHTGHVRIYQWSGTNWTQMGVDIDGEAAWDNSGCSVSLSADGNRIAIGAFDNDGNSSNAAGHVRIYHWTGSNWTQIGADIDGEAIGDQSGFSVSLSDDGSRIAIGSFKNSGNGNSAGHVRIYEGFIPDPIPTMSQWALFILGLCLTSMAVVTIRKSALGVG